MKTLTTFLAASGVKVTQAGEWTFVTLGPPENAIWKFTLPGHAAHPAAVRSTIVNENRIVSIRLAALCEAARRSCDRMMAESRRLNERMREHMQKAGLTH